MELLSAMEVEILPNLLYIKYLIPSLRLKQDYNNKVSLNWISMERLKRLKTKLKAAKFAVLIFCQYKKDIVLLVQMKNPAVLNYFVKWREPKEPLNNCSGKVNIRALYA